MFTKLTDKLKSKVQKKKEKADSEKETEYLWTQSIGKLIRIQSYPAIIGQFVMALYNFADRAFIGNSIGLDGLAALTVILPAYLIISSFWLALWIWASSIISRALWAKQFEKVNQTFWSSQLVILISTLLLVLFFLFFQDQILTLFWATEDIMWLARDYFSIVIFGQVFWCFMFASTAIIRAIGDTKSVMLINIVSALTNILLDYVFIFIYDWGIKWAAWATVISQIVATLIILYYYFFQQKVIKLSINYFKIKREYVKEIFLLGIPAFFRQVIGSIMMILVNNFLGSEWWKQAISLCWIAQGLVVFFLTPIFGVTQGIAPILGYNYGAKYYQRVKDTLRISINALSIFWIIISLIYLIYPEFLLNFFVTTPEELELAAIPTKICMYSFFSVGIQIIIGTYYQSIWLFKKAFILSLLRQVFVFIPILFLFSKIFHLMGIYYTFPISDIIALVITLLIFRKDWLKLSKLSSPL